MTSKNNRLKVIFVGFLLLIIPIIIFIYNLNSLYIYSKERTKETLRQQILTQSRNIEENLNPFNYLKNEFEKYMQNCSLISLRR